MAARADPDIEIDPERLAAWLAEESPPEVIDVREPHERDAGYIEGSAHVPLARLAESAQARRERPVVFYCRVGARSRMAAEAFRSVGIDAYTMAGGLLRWASEGRPLAPEGGEVAEHQPRARLDGIAQPRVDGIAQRHEEDRDV
ncbi:MAG: rhodanese-like domain-containing protein [Solirubrobacteraceae bacterium]